MPVERSITKGTVIEMFPAGMSFTNRVEGIDGSKAHLSLREVGTDKLKLYLLESLVTEEKFRKRGLATGLLGEINKFLEEKMVMGLLVNIIDKDRGESEIYTKTGWKEKRKNIYIYQPKGVSDQQVDKTMFAFGLEIQNIMVMASRT